jgi:hypothetical protein
MVKKCRELNSEIVGNAAKVQTALKLSEEDQQTIVALKKEIEKAWKTVDASHEKVSSSVVLPHVSAAILYQQLCVSHGHLSCCCMRVLSQEAQAKDSITQLKAEIANLTRLAEAGSALSSGEEAALNELMKQKEELTRERDTQVRFATHTRQPLKVLRPALRSSCAEQTALCSCR